MAKSTMSNFVIVRARSVIDNKNGTFGIEVPCEPLTTSQLKALDELFPNVRVAAEALLAKEMLLAALASEAEIAAEPASTGKKFL